MSVDMSMKLVYDELIRHDKKTANLRMAMLNTVISVYATMHTWPEQMSITRDEFDALEDIFHDPLNVSITVPDCLPRLAYDALTVIRENNDDMSIEEILEHGVNEMYSSYIAAQFNYIYRDLKGEFENDNDV